MSDVFVFLAANPVKFSGFYAVTYIGLIITAIRRAGVIEMDTP